MEGEKHTLVADGSVGSDDGLLHLGALVLCDESGSNAETGNAAVLGKVEAQSLCVVVDGLALHQDQADEALVTTLEALGSLNAIASLVGDVALLGLGGGLAESTALVAATVLALGLGAS